MAEKAGKSGQLGGRKKYSVQPCGFVSRVKMGQNPSEHSDYMQVLRTLFKSSGVEVSHSSFKKLFCAIEKYYHWLDPDKGTLRHE